ncbi:MAG: hypothetical protein GTO40_19025 [Deltaproteobacteria bacterium]|nr:hypothetical protein [Deltaproteobacteria bacterium]
MTDQIVPRTLVEEIRLVSLFDRLFCAHFKGMVVVVGPRIEDLVGIHDWG